MKKVGDREDLKFFILEGCSNPELAEVFECSVRTICNRKKEYGLLNLTPNNETTPIIDGNRECIRCNKVQELSKFNKQCTAKTGYRSICKACQAGEGREYYTRNVERRKATNAKYYEANKARTLERSSKRRASKINATPSWYNELDSLAFQEMREKCAILEDITGIPHEIDHIIPLQHEKVCGLHYHKNWQILTRAQNRAKHNKLL